MPLWKLYHCSAFPSPGKKQQVSFSEIFPQNLPAVKPLYRLSVPLQVKPTAAAIQDLDVSSKRGRQRDPSPQARASAALGRDWEHTAPRQRGGQGPCSIIRLHIHYLSSPICCTYCSGSYLLSGVYGHSKDKLFGTGLHFHVMSDHI